MTALTLAAVLVIQAQAWGPEVRLTTNTTIAETGLNHGCLTVGPGGSVTAAWAEQDGPNNNFRIYTRTRIAGTWESEALAVDFKASYAGTSLGAKFPALAYVPGDTLLMVWHDYRVDGILNCELFTKTRAPGEAWSDSTEELRLTTSQHPETNGDNSLVPSLTVTPDGTPHVAWYDYRYDADNSEILFKSRAGGAWNTTPGDAPDTNVSNNGGESHFPALAAGPDGSLHLAWRDNTAGSYQIYYARRSPAGAWSAPVALSPPGIPASGAALAASPTGKVTAVWSDSRSGASAVYARERSAGGAWSGPARVSPPAVGASAPTVAVDAGGTRHIAWDDARISVFNRNVYIQSAADGAPWDSTGASDTRLSLGGGSAVRATIMVKGVDLFVMWQDASHGPTEIYFRSSETVVGLPGQRPVLRAFPNPFINSLKVINLPSGLHTLHLMDVQGRRAASASVQYGAARFDTSNLPAGIYFVMDPRRQGTLGKVLRIK